MNKKILYFLGILLSFCFISNVNAENYKSFDYTFTSSVGYTNELVTEITNSGGTIQDEALYLNGSSYIKYDFAKFEYDIANLTIEFDFKKIGSDSYPRLLYLGGINREIEVKGASRNMYIGGEVTTTWVQNEWNHLKIVYNSETIEYYVNDVSVKTENYTGDITFLQFGQGSATNNRFTGYIDNLSLKVTLDDTAYFLKTDRSKIIYDKDANILKTYYDNVLTGSVDLNEYPYVIVEHFAVGQLFYSKYPFIYSSVHASENDFGGFLPTGDYYKFQINQSPTLYTYSADNVQNLYPIFQTEYLNASYDVTDIDTNTIYVKKMNIFDSSLPNASITKERETSVTILDHTYITNVTLKIDFSVVDNSKYLYMYKYGLNSDWTQLVLTSGNSKQLTFNTNDTLYVQVIEIATNKVISNATLSITEINYDSTPYIEIDEIATDNCIANDVTICKTLRINSHINDFNKYSFYVFNNTLGTSAKFNKQTINYPIYTNSLIEVRIVDNTTNKIIDQKYYEITTIPGEVSGLGQYITKECHISDVGQVYTCLYYIYNYDNSKYDYYYGTSISSYELIDNSILTVVPTGSGSVIYKKQYTEDTIAYFKIVEKSSNNTIYEKSFPISYTSDIDEWFEEYESNDLNDIQNFVNTHIFSKLKFISQLKTIYDSIFLYDIQEGTDAPSFTFDLSFIHMKPITVVLEIDYNIRSQIHGYIKLFATLSVVFTFVKEFAKYWNK